MTGVNFVDTLERPAAVQLLGGDCDSAIGIELWAFQARPARAARALNAEGYSRVKLSLR